jgi:hypothetical protein
MNNDLQLFGVEIAEADKDNKNENQDNALAREAGDLMES